MVVGEKVLYGLLSVIFLSRLDSGSLRDIYLGLQVTALVALMLLAEELLQEICNLLTCLLICCKQFKYVVGNVLFLTYVEHVYELIVEENNLTIL